MLNTNPLRHPVMYYQHRSFRSLMHVVFYLSRPICIPLATASQAVISLLLVLGLYNISSLVSAQTIRYVSTTGTNSNPISATSWATATPDLQGAINASPALGQVWVKAGTYKPGGAANTNRNLSFTLKSRVLVYGGFAGTETTLSQRPATFPSSTILSGELGNPASTLDNSYHVVSNTVLLLYDTALDGFVIQNGRADGTGQNGMGGGLLNIAPVNQISSISLRNCLLIDNYALDVGGAIVSYANSLGTAYIEASKCVFQTNVAYNRGGAIFSGTPQTTGQFENEVANVGFNQLVFSDCQFINNHTDLTSPGFAFGGGAVYINGFGDLSKSFFTRCRFETNYSKWGGAVSNVSGLLAFNSCGFVKNSSVSQGGAIYSVGRSLTGIAKPVFSNCSFVANHTTTSNNRGQLMAQGSFSQAQLVNCIIFGNGNAAYNTGPNDTFQTTPANATLTVTSSLLDNTATNYTGINSFTTATSPFSDNVTLAIYPCPPVLNGSDASATTTLLSTTDLNGNSRFIGTKADLGAVEYQSVPPAASAGSITLSAFTLTTICAGSPIPTISNSISSAGFTYHPYNWQVSVNGGNFTTIAGQTGAGLPSQGTMPASGTMRYQRVAFDCNDTPYVSNVITFSPASTLVTPGTIGGPPLVPSPQEGTPQLISVTPATAYIPSFYWQQSDDDGSNWAVIPNSNAQNLSMPTVLTPTSKTVQFRRVVTNGCSLSAASAPVSVKVMHSLGRITGRVIGRDGTAVPGVTITVRRITTGLAGSPDNYSYTALTDGAGKYTIAPVYWGFPSGTPAPTSLTASTFITTPSFPGQDPVHVFSPPSLTYTIDEYTNANDPYQDIIDQTTFGISGSVSQSCPDCIIAMSGNTPLTGLMNCPLDSAEVRIDGVAYTSLTKSGIIEGVSGRYALSVNNPGSYTLSATYKDLVFTSSVPTRPLSVSTNVYNVNFTTPTSRTLIGKLSAGCGEAIGSAVLEFTDVVLDKDGKKLPACFKKRVTTTDQGIYLIVLPARNYEVKVISFTPNQVDPALTTGVPAFINALPVDSLTRDLTTAPLSATTINRLNLVYQRPPTLLIKGLSTPPGCSSLVAPYALMKQSQPTALSITVYQGPVGGCLLTSSTLTVSTNIQTEGGQDLSKVVTTGTTTLTLVPGKPNIIAPYYRTLNIQCKAPFGQTATPFTANVVVTGALPGQQTFETVSPELPLLVLHDPPGDGSFSTWASNTSQEQAIRMYAASDNVTKGWLEVKVGTKFEAGIGLATETNIWGTLGGGVETTSRSTSANETILTTSIQEEISTSSDPSNVGASADLFIGAAFNMLYAVSTVIAFDPASCSISSSQQLVVAPKGDTPTKFYYTERKIRDEVIPNLENLRNLSALAAEKTRYANQIKLWQQILDNNEENKRKAEFLYNVSFGGDAGPFSSVTTFSETKSNTLEFSMLIDTQVALGLGFEIAGSGASGGVSVNFKIETGNSETNSITKETSVAYTLDDKDSGDRFTVDVKKDPVYGTPVFELVAGETSCPPETNTRARDNFQLSAPVTIISNVPANGEAVFTLKLGNISEVITDASRTANLQLVPESNSSGAEVIVNGSPYILPIPYNLGRLATETEVIVKIRRGNPNVYSYEGLQFQLADACTGDIVKTVSLSVFFQSPCSSVNLVTPQPGWITTIADNNQLPILIDGYTVANLTTITLEYAQVGTSSWYTGFTLPSAQLNNSVNGTQSNWNTSGLADGAYKLRLKLACALGNGGTGFVYSTASEGIIDRTAPVLFGNTQPTNDVYVPGSSIGASYNEQIRCSTISNNNVVAKRLVNGQAIPVSVGCFNNQVGIVPMANLSPFAGEVISVTLTGVADLYGNMRTTPDIWTFKVGNATAATGSNALSVTTANSPMAEDTPGTMNVIFRLQQPASNNILINFGVAGTASYGVDYTTTFSQSASQPLSATMNGVEGKIMILAGATSATLLIDPIADTNYETDETILISLLEGGDYQIGGASAATAVISNDDPINSGSIITSLQTGNWEDTTTWDLNRIPILTDQVIINQNHTVTLTGTGNAKKLTKRSNARLKMATSTTRLRLGF